MPGAPLRAVGSQAQVEEAFRTLPGRYLGAHEGFDATYEIRLGDIGRTYTVHATQHTARVSRGARRKTPDVVIGTDAATWLRLRQGDTNGVDAFAQRDLYARGNLDLALGFEGLFRLPNGRDPLLKVHQIELPGRTVSTLSMGEGPDVMLVHGLGAAKTSFFFTAADLVRAGYRVHAIDLPGFGHSSKPLTAPYNAGWFADTILAAMDAMGIERAHLVGNSMGGRASIEVGLRAPERVISLVLLCPAIAFIKRDFHPLVRLAQPALGAIPHRFLRGMVAGQVRALFRDPDALDPAVADLIVDEFQRIYASAGARLGFLTSARNIYLDRPFGRGGFYPRLAELQPPALFVWGTHDSLIPMGFRKHVAQWLPQAEQIVLEECGHVPQVERPAQTNGLIRRFISRADVVERRTARAARAA